MPAPSPVSRPAVTILKPLYGDEPGLEAALASNLMLDWPAYQVVFGVADASDPAMAVVRRLRARFPQADIAVVANATQHGSNRKISNLINMFPQAKHDILVISDADVHVDPDYLVHVAAALERPGVGLATTLYAGLATVESRVAALGATAITHNFLPGALMSRAMGNQDCLGATMALRRATLAEIGGLPAIANHLADDYLLGKLVREAGHAIAFAHTIPMTTVPETSLLSLWRHELRWARTIRALVPVQFVLSLLQYEMAWAILAVALCPSLWTLSVLGLVWAIAAWSGAVVEGAVGSARVTKLPAWLLPFRDLLSFGTTLASYASNRVDWRGQPMHAEALPRSAGSFGTELS